MRICLPVVAETEEEALRKMDRPLPEDPLLEILFELRLDRMRKISMERVLRGKRKKIVVTNRRREEGGGFRGPEKERVAYLLEAVASGADYVDIEGSTDPALLAEMKKAIAAGGSRTLLIVSSHDFAQTPSAEALVRRFAESAAQAPDIVKIVGRANNAEDNLKILRLIPHARRAGREIIAFCLGEKGRISRVFSLFLGAHLAFASLGRGEESAPGQLSFEEMIAALSLLNGRPGGRPEGFRGPGEGESPGV